MKSISRTTSVLLALSLSSAIPVCAQPVSAITNVAELAERLVRAYHAGNVEVLKPHLAPGLRFRDPKLGQDLELDGFLDMAAKTAAVENDRELEITWAGATDSHADVRGTWSWTDAESGKRRELVFSIELDFETGEDGPKVVSWLDDFRRRRMWKPAEGDGELETENFRVVYFEDEFTQSGYHVSPSD